jgi:hypothetical protein
MAHLNIEERRAFVREHFDRYQLSKKRELLETAAALFNCSINAITSDINSIIGKKYKRPLVEERGWRKVIYDRDGKVCQYCKATGVKMIIEHIVPTALGGKTINENMVVACVHCNCVKRRNIWIPSNFMDISKDNPELQSRVLKDAIKDFR